MVFNVHFGVFSFYLFSSH